MKPAIELLEQELSQREALDPEFFKEEKQASLAQAVKLGVDERVMKALLGL